MMTCWGLNSSVMKGQNREHRKVEKTMKGQKGESGEIEM